MEILVLYIQYFISFFKIGLFGFGGGYAMLSLVQHEVVEVHQWISASVFTDIVAVSQVTPGPIAFNTATYIGYSATNSLGYSTWQAVLGSAICTTAVSLPSLIIMTIICKFFFKFKNNIWVQCAMNGLKPTVIGLIAAAAIMLITPLNFIDNVSWIIFGVVFIASFRNVNPILLIVLAGIAGWCIY